MKFLFLALGILGGFVGSLPAAAQERTPSPSLLAVEGGEIAARWCVQCHVLRQPAQGTDAAPTFAQIAQNRSDAQIRAFLARPHGGMPPLTLSAREIEAVIAYLSDMRETGALPIRGRDFGGTDMGSAGR